MKLEGLSVGVSAGLLLALFLVAGASFVGPAASHIDLVGSVSAPASQSGNSSPSGAQVTGSVVVQPATEPDTALPPSPSISSLGSLSTDTGSTLGLLFLPIFLAVLFGGLFYGLFARRADAE